MLRLCVSQYTIYAFIIGSNLSKTFFVFVLWHVATSVGCPSAKSASCTAAEQQYIYTAFINTALIRTKAINNFSIIKTKLKCLDCQISPIQIFSTNLHCVLLTLLKNNMLLVERVVVLAGQVLPVVVYRGQCFCTYCESLPGSCGECKSSTLRLLTLVPSQSTWAHESVCTLLSSSLVIAIRCVNVLLTSAW